MKTAKNEADEILRPLKNRAMPKVRQKLLRKAANIKNKAMNAVVEYTLKNFNKIAVGEFLGSFRDNLITGTARSIREYLSSLKLAKDTTAKVSIQGEECC